MVISDDGRRLGLGGHLGAAEERLGRGQVPPFTKQYVDHLAVLVDGAVEVPLDAAAEEEDLVDVPAAKPMTMPPGRGRELWTEGLGPGEHGPGRDINAALTKELGNLPGGERVAQVPTDRDDDDLRRPTVPREGTAGSVGEVPMTGAGQAVPHSQRSLPPTAHLGGDESMTARDCTGIIVSCVVGIALLAASCGSSASPAGSATEAVDQTTKAYLTVVNADFPPAYPPGTTALAACPSVDSPSCKPALGKIRAAASKFLADIANTTVPPRLANDNDLLKRGLHMLLDGLDAVTAAVDAKDAAGFEVGIARMREAERQMSEAKADLSVQAAR